MPEYEIRWMLWFSYRTEHDDLKAADDEFRALVKDLPGIDVSGADYGYVLHSKEISEVSGKTNNVPEHSDDGEE